MAARYTQAQVLCKQASLPSRGHTGEGGGGGVPPNYMTDDAGNIIYDDAGNPILAE